MGIFISNVGPFMKRILYVDSRGRIVIPSDVRKMLGIGKIVKMSIKDNKIIIEPVKDPLDELSNQIVKVHIKASVEPSELSKMAYSRLMEEIRSEGEKEKGDSN